MPAYFIANSHEKKIIIILSKCWASPLCNSLLGMKIAHCAIESSQYLGGMYICHLDLNILHKPNHLKAQTFAKK